MPNSEGHAGPEGARLLGCYQVVMLLGSVEAARITCFNICKLLPDLRRRHRRWRIEYMSRYSCRAVSKPKVYSNCI